MFRCNVCRHVASEPFKFCPECGAPAAGASAREERKTVTVLFCDVVGSTELGERLDPESLRRVLARYFEHGARRDRAPRRKRRRSSSATR